MTESARLCLCGCAPSFFVRCAVFRFGLVYFVIPFLPCLLVALLPSVLVAEFWRLFFVWLRVNLACLVVCFFCRIKWCFSSLAQHRREQRTLEWCVNENENPPAGMTLTTRNIWVEIFGTDSIMVGNRENKKASYSLCSRIYILVSHCGITPTSRRPPNGSTNHYARSCCPFFFFTFGTEYRLPARLAS